MAELEHAVEVAVQAAREAGSVILRHYKQGGAVDLKADASPVTRADLEANDVILAILRAAFPDDGIRSEEGGGERTSHRVWIVDPLDGTRDFVAGTDEFCVHVGLAIDGRPVVGAVYQPVADAMYYAYYGAGAWRVENDRKTRLQVSQRERALRVGISRLNLSDRLAQSLAGFEVHRMGASTKHMLLAAGGLDAVINVSHGENEWDTCAPEVILREAGGELTDVSGARFVYNQPDPCHPRGSIASNGVCHAALIELVRSWG
jgi:3'(2'),5'-bisphosphate nucleotidase